MKLRINSEPLNTDCAFAWPVELITPPEYDPADLLLPHYSTSAEHPRLIATSNSKHNIREEIIKCLKVNQTQFEQLYQFSFWNQFASISDWYDHHITEQITVVEDQPGYSMAQHVDNRVVFGAIICNLTDNPPGTEFPVWEYQLPGKINTGVFYLNHDLNLHSITVTGDQPRLTVQILLYLTQLSVNKSIY